MASFRKRRGVWYSRVSQDFPTIVSMYVNEAKIGAWDTKKWDTVALPATYIT